MTKHGSINQVCSLGGGIASTALFLMSLHDEVETPAECAIFADTGAELETTLNTINKLSEYAKGFGVDVIITRSRLGNIADNVLKHGSKVGDIPFFTLDKNGKKTQLSKYCTNEFKTYPIWKVLRKEFGATYKKPVVYWLGYTVDEIHRMKPAKRKYVVRRYPLIEKRIGRDECYRYLERYGFTETATSACWCCPYRRDNEYSILSKVEYEKAVRLEKDVNQRGMVTGTQTSELRIHRSLTPLAERPFENTDQLQLDIDDVCDGDSCFT